MKAYVALGSNIQPRVSYLNKAIQLLANHDKIQVTHQSPIYETDPVGFVEQGQFLNMVLEIETELEPTLLLDVCQRIERKLGRRREIRWGPRTIDLDILLYDQEEVETERLVLPHPRLQERAFVLIPLADIRPYLYITYFDQTVSELLTTLPVQDKEGVVRWQQTNGVRESKPFEN
ncbi:2-amino-4-hydroxy-6-hydroxymethyldihydropteridine diphosphokinase [Gracilibacillus caseinilyticus]|uniref:2-amino-4-hydroxy-6-hydroxymethyldihydropteridine diphosphokinase n=1 Tax=Gracilibacillus caseinilyticus TaxID=2932256 RepID=A0ABY4EYY6_9BACI|nr:2-amino-4-hydroxy-6-hydroxymethyldihydropteridine diphosphokinase [Gracilibacillus caseinilyticus]UOQ49489.1 2-amino-4-hydroxy-6-hydroxymethyldihydropteridine diphosphokinase [Gracilibacillus caseinilyticus]